MREAGLYFVQVYNVRCTFVDTCRCVRPQRWGTRYRNNTTSAQRCTEMYEDITHLCLLYNIYILGSYTIIHTLLEKKGNLEESRAQLYMRKTPADMAKLSQISTNKRKLSRMYDFAVLHPIDPQKSFFNNLCQVP
jgi:hypothetical protein